MIREAYRSVADLCIIPMQDYLVKGKEARINHPGTLGENWQWRLQPNFLSKDLSDSIYKLAKLYGRIPKAEEKEKKNNEGKRGTVKESLLSASCWHILHRVLI